MTEYGNLHLYKQKNGNWKGVLYYYDAEHKRKCVTKTSKLKTKRDAKKELEAWAEELREKGRRGISLKKNNQGETVEAVITRYLDSQLEKGKLERSTYTTQLNRLKKHVFPQIGDIDFATVNKDVIELWITELYNSNLAIGTIHGIYADVAKVYKYYFKQGELKFNPFEFVDTPSKSQSKKTFLSKEQMREFVKCMEEEYKPSDAMYTAICLAMYAGLRRGEICGLRWFDIDFNRNTLTVSSSIGVANGTYTKAPKNNSSKRTFPMIPQLAEALKIRYEAVQEEYGTINHDWFVCGNARTYLSPTHISRLFKSFVKEYQLVDYYGNEVKLHSLRHNFATLGVNAHIDIASLSKMMGHASKAMTLDTYADSSPEAMKLATAQLGSSFTAIEE